MKKQESGLMKVQPKPKNGYCSVCSRRISLKKNGLAGDHVSYKEPYGCSGSQRPVLKLRPIGLPFVPSLKYGRAMGR